MKRANDAKNKLYLVGLLPLIGIVLLVPLVVYAKLTNLEGYLYLVWNGEKTHADFFTVWKGIVFFIFTVLATGIFAYQKYKKVLRKADNFWISIPLFLYGLFIVLSTVFSNYKDVAFFGMIDRHEGMFVLLSYCFICYYTYKLIENTKYAQKLLNYLVISSSIIFILGIFQYLGYDYFRTDLAKKIILGSNYNLMKNSIQYMSDKNVIYSTLFHYNYVGTYVSILLPLLGVLTLFTRQRKWQVIYGIILFLGIVVLFNSFARSAFICVAFAVVIAGLLFWKKITNNKRNTVLIAISFLIVFVTIGFFAKDALEFRYINTLQEIKTLKNSFTAKGNNYENVPIRNIILSDQKVRIITDTSEITMKFDKEGAISFEDERNKELSFNVNQENGNFKIIDERYKDYNINAGNLPDVKDIFVIKFGYKDTNLLFDVANNKFVLINNQGFKFDYKNAEKWGFEGAETFASGRGYIWSRTIPLLKNTIFTGYGPDNFIFYFPQADFVGKYKAYKDIWVLVDKPHNMYLNIAVSTGVVSLLAVLVLFGAYFVRSFRLYYNCDMSKEHNVYGVACFLAFCGYIAVGIFNDSVVCVAPVFWVLLGLGIAMNELARKDKAAEVSKISTK